MLLAVVKPGKTKASMKALSRFSFFLSLYALFVIVWGAWVRISKSGDGCGEHWPLCHGEWVPVAASLPTWIEFFHRVTSGLFGLLVLTLLIWAWRRLPKGHPGRVSVVVASVFTISEALLGAKLVLSGLVGADDSVARAWVMALHLVNSLFLTASLALTWAFTQGWRFERRRPSSQAVLGCSLIVLGYLLLGATGAIAALSKTLFPIETLGQGLMEHFQKDSHVLVRLRIWHPLVSTILGGGMIFGLWVLQREAAGELKRALHRSLVLIVLALVVGYLTLFLLSPLLLKLVHLLLAHLVWMALIVCLSRFFIQAAKS